MEEEILYDNNGNPEWVVTNELDENGEPIIIPYEEQ